MTILKQFNEIEDLFNKNRMLLNVVIGYCKNDIDKNETISNILQVLEILAENQGKIKNLTDDFWESLIQD